MTVRMAHDWMDLPAQEIATYVAPHHLSLLVSLDGTRRWLLTHAPETYEDWERATARLAESTLALVDRIFALGVQVVVVPLLYPPNFERGSEWVQAALGTSGMSRLVDPLHRRAYERWNTRVRLSGTWRRAAPPLVAPLDELDEQLRQVGSTGERLLLWEVDVIDPMKAMLQVAAERGADPDTVHAYFYPEGPRRLDLAIKSGWSSNSFVLPTLLQQAQLYFITNLMLDLSELQLRAILRDFLFHRRLVPEDGMAYSPDLRAAYRDWYLAQEPRLHGSGELAPGKIWVARGGLAPDELG